LERYLYTLKDQLNDSNGMGGKISSDDKSKIQDALKESNAWLEKNAESAVKEDFEEEKGRVEKIVEPIVRKLYGSEAGGAQPPPESGAGAEAEAEDKEEL
jgi:heat shock protein 5